MSASVALSNTALALIGTRPLQSETAPGAGAVLQFYESTLTTLLALKPWSFARRTAQLARFSAVPANPGWTAQFQLPVDRSGPPTAYYAAADDISDRPLLDFELAGDVVMTKGETLWVTYPVTPPIEQRPALFTECHKLMLAAELALHVRNDAGLRQQLRAEVLGDPRVPGASGLLYQAAAIDAGAQPSRIMLPVGGPLLDIRRTGVWAGRR